MNSEDMLLKECFVIGCMLMVLTGCASTEQEKPSQIQIDDRYGQFKQQAQDRLQKGQLRTDSSIKQCEKAKRDLATAQQKGNHAQIQANIALIKMLCKGEE